MAVLLLVSALSTCYTLILLGIDPMFSVPKALMYCKDSAWIHLDATPFYSLMRSSGSVFRLAVVSIFFLMPGIAFSKQGFGDL